MLTQAEFRAICSAELGKPYVWGASGPAAYDCSGLAQMLLETLNLDPPGDQTAEGLYRFFLRGGRSTAVALPDCALGDLIFFGGPASISHVALGWGGGDMLEAGGGGRTTTSAAIARQQGAEVRIRPITRRRDRIAILRPAALAWESGLESVLEAVAGFGRFEGTPLTEWLSDGRHMQLKRPYAYFAEDGTDWPVPAEAIVDGASIPQPFWSVIGGPFEDSFVSCTSGVGASIQKASPSEIAAASFGDTLYRCVALGRRAIGQRDYRRSGSEAPARTDAN